MESIFASLKFRHPEKAFNNAIKKGLKNPEEYMYMNSSRWFDYFKHKDTRCYRQYFNIGKLMTHKEYVELVRRLENR